MINDTINGIALKLREDFPDCKVYTEEIKQGLKTPCFFIACIRPAERLFLGSKYIVEQKFIVRYFPKTQTVEENYSIASRLFTTLEYISIGNDLTRGSEMDSTIVDGVLQFLVSYNMFIRKNKEKSESMEALELNGETKK